MRLKTEVWVAALLRRVFADGGYAAIERRGADEAGAIFIRQRLRDGRHRLYAPAPQTVFETEKPAERVFELRLEDVEADRIDERLARERRFDPDLWIIEIEVEDVAPYLTVTRG